MTLEGELTTFGTDAFPGPALRDGEMVKRLRDAGPELAMLGFTEFATYGAVPARSAFPPPVAGSSA